MHKNPEVWVALISDRTVTQSFVGTEVRIPKQGEQVRVLHGPLTGSLCTVVAVRGLIYSPAQKVFLDVPGDTPTFVYPWDVEVLTG